MSDSKLDLLGRARARENAGTVADLIGARVRSSRLNVVGEPDCPYELRWNEEPFWFGVRMSDSAYVVRGTHRRRFESPVQFLVSLKTPDHAMLATSKLTRLSSELGVPVFARDAQQGSMAAAAFRSPECKLVLSRIDFEPVWGARMNPVQLHVVSDFVSPQHCASQVKLFRELLSSVWRWSLRSLESG